MKPRDEYDFPNGENGQDSPPRTRKQPSIASEHGKKLSSAVQEVEKAVKGLRAKQRGTESTVGSLKSLSENLALLPQEPKLLQKCMSNLVPVLTDNAFLTHKDQMVRLHAADALMQLLWILAPDSDIINNDLESFFTAMISTFPFLRDPDAPAFPLALSTFRKLRKTKCYLLLLDLEDSTLTVKLFDELLTAAGRPKSAEVIGKMVEEVLLVSIQEKEDSELAAEETGDILHTLAAHIIPGLRTNNNTEVAQRVWEEAIRYIDIHAHSSTDKFVDRLVSVPATLPIELRDHRPFLLHQVYEAAPTALQGSWGPMESGLRSEDVTERKEMAWLVGGLLRHGGKAFEEDRKLVERYLARFLDMQAEIRADVVEHTAGILSGCPEEYVDKFLDGVVGRLEDTDEKVRVAAVKSVCESFSTAPNLMTTFALAKLEDRMRDKKLGVRKAVIAGLLGLLRTLSSSLSEDGAFDNQDVVLELLAIPAKVSRACLLDAETRQFAGPLLHSQPLLPPSLSASAAARLWAQMFAAVDVVSQDKLINFISVKHRALADLGSWMLAREKLASKSHPQQQEYSEAVLVETAAKLAVHVGQDVRKGAELMSSLVTHKDKKVFAVLRKACDPGLTEKEFETLKQQLAKMLGSSNPLSGFLSAVLIKARPSFLTPLQAVALLDLVGEGRQEGQNAALLLRQAGKVAPSIFAPLVPELLEVLEGSNDKQKDVAAKLLLNAVKFRKPMSASVSRPAPERQLQRFLQLAEDPHPAVAYASVAAMCLLHSKEETLKVVQQLSAKLLKAFTPKNFNQPSTPATLQALASLGCYAADAFGPHVEKFVHLVLDRYMDADLDQGSSTDKQAKAAKAKGRDKKGGKGGDQNTGNGSGTVWDNPPLVARLKAAALKAVGRALMPDVPMSQKDSVESITTAVVYGCEKLTMLMDLQDEAVGGADAKVVAGHIRLAAAATCLRFTKHHEKRILLEAYLALALLVQDPLVEVRKGMLSKLNKAIHRLSQSASTAHSAAKYAACLVLSGVDPVSANLERAAQSLWDFVSTRRGAAAHKVAANLDKGDGKGSEQVPQLSRMAEFVVPFCLWLLAHHPDCPAPSENPSEDELLPFQRMLQFVLDVLMVGDGTQPAAESLPIILKCVKHLKATCVDAADDPMNDRLYMMCDITLAMAKAVAERELQQVPSRLLDKNVAVTLQLPAKVLKMVDPGGQELKDKKPYGSHLPPNFHLDVTDAPLATVLNRVSAAGAAAPTATAAAGAARRRAPHQPRARAAGPISPQALDSSSPSHPPKRPPSATLQPGAPKRPRSSPSPTVPTPSGTTEAQGESHGTDVSPPLKFQGPGHS